MPVKYTQTSLDKIEKILGEASYILRYEKGNFTSGYCILEHRKVVVIKKFLDLEGRINTLMDILPTLKVSEDTLSPESKKMYQLILKEAVSSQEVTPEGPSKEETEKPDETDH